MDSPSAAFLADAIRDHRDQYAGGVVNDPRDSELYQALITYETALDHGQTQDDFLQQATQLVR